MANTGYKQALIAYKVDRLTGQPLDINGIPISESGLRQAIFLLQGTSNPAPSLYQVEGYFNVGEFIYGEPTQAYRPDDCPAGIIYVSPNRLLMKPTDGPVAVLLFSSDTWLLLSQPPIATVSPLGGAAGSFDVSIVPNGTEGQGWFIFQNTVSGAQAKVYVIITADTNSWILVTGFWDNLGFWFSDGIWNY